MKETELTKFIKRTMDWPAKLVAKELHKKNYRGRSGKKMKFTTVYGLRNKVRSGGNPGTQAQKANILAPATEPATVVVTPPAKSGGSDAIAVMRVILGAREIPPMQKLALIRTVVDNA